MPAAATNIMHTSERYYFTVEIWHFIFIYIFSSHSPYTVHTTKNILICVRVLSAQHTYTQTDTPTNNEQELWYAHFFYIFFSFSLCLVRALSLCRISSLYNIINVFRCKFSVSHIHIKYNIHSQPPKHFQQRCGLLVYSDVLVPRLGSVQLSNGEDVN